MRKTLCCVLAGLIIVLNLLSTKAQATEGDPERSLQTTARMLRELSWRLQVALAEGRNMSADVEILKRLGELLQSNDMLMRERLRVRGNALQQMNGEGVLRHKLAVERYQSTATRLHAAVAKVSAADVPDQSLIVELLQAITELVPQRLEPIHGLLPYRQPGFLPKSPVFSPQIVPAYRMAAVQPAVLADLSGTPESPVSPIIAQLAQLIAAEAGHSHWDPAVIYNWVRKNIRTEWYWGSMKGAEETLRQRSGNDADQAALLIALLRSAGYPARFVRGTIEFFPGLDAALSATGIDDPERLPAFFQAAGIPCEAIRDGGVVSNVRIEHIWVEALIPYANYRGLVDDTSDKLWLPLDTSVKTGTNDIASAIDLYALPGNPIPGFRDRYLAADHVQPPLAELAMETEQFLSTGYPGGNMFTEVPHSRQQQLESIVIVPGSLQFVDVAMTAEYAALPVELQHHARLRAEFVNTPGLLLFDLTLPVRDLSNRQIIIGFEPETVADQEIINLWGGLANTPAYLVRMRPTLVVDGKRMVIAADGLVYGEDFILTVDFTAPGLHYFHQNTSEIRPVLEIEYETPEIMGSYPAVSPRVPCFDGIGQKTERIISYYNVKDYALTTGGELTFAWEYNNRTKPDETRGYRYLGDFSSYPEQLLPQQGFVLGHRDLSLVYVVDRELRFPVDRYEIFAYAAESRSKAIGAVHHLPAFAELSATTASPGSRDLEAFAGFTEEHYSHSRQFRSNVIDEQQYWQAFITDTGLKRS